MGFARGVKKQKGWRGVFPRAKTPLESVEGYAGIVAGLSRDIFGTRSEFDLFLRAYSWFLYNNNQSESFIISLHS